MHNLYHTLLNRYMNEAGDGTEGGSGGGTTDAPSQEQLRGDFLQEETKADPAPAPAVKTEPETKPEPETKAEDTGPTIPKARFDEAVNKERSRADELARQLQELQNSKVSQAAAENIQTLQDAVAAKREAYENALFEGDREQAAKIRGELHAAEAEYNKALTTNMSVAAVEQYKAEQAFNTAVAKIEGDYPEFNPDSELFNEELSTKAVELMDAFRAKGESPAVALQKASELIAQASGLVPTSKRNQEPATPAAPAAKTPDQIIKEAETAAKSKAVARNVDAANRQPPNINTLGADADMDGMSKSVDVSNMTDKQFAAFKADENALAKARGDLL